MSIVLRNANHYTADYRVYLRGYDPVSLSEARFTKILELIRKGLIPCGYLESQILELCNLEKCVRKSDSFNLENVTRLFSLHITFLKNSRYDFDQQVYPTSPMTYLDLAIENRAPALVTALIETGRANYVTQNVIDRLLNPYDAPREVTKECIDIFVKKGWNLNHSRYGHHQFPALWEAIRRENDKGIWALVNAKADINRQLHHRYATPLHFAVQRDTHTWSLSQMSENIKLIIELGGDIFALNPIGETPEDLARASNRKEVIYLLKNRVLLVYKEVQKSLTLTIGNDYLINIVMDYLKSDKFSIKKTESKESEEVASV